MNGPPDIAKGVRPGDVLAGKYRVERVLGAGGMGVVVAAHHEQLDTKVALKFLLPEALANPEAVARFIREARAAVKITGEHVARVSDVGQLDNGSPYIVMEYLEGIDLSAWLKQRGALPIELAVDFVLQACEAIADAHVLGIVHRDLKPANLFCVQRSDGQLSIKVLDFGISKFTTPGTSSDITRTTALVGSPYYMSPEQLQSSKAVDARADIWSLGIILFELVSGRRPFDAEAVTELAIKIAMDPTPMVRAFRAEAPPALEQVIATCLEKDRSRRYQTVGDLALALQGFCSRQARVSVERVLGTLRQAGMGGAFAPPSNGFQAPARQGPLAGSLPNTSASWGKSSSIARPGGMAAIAIGGVVLLLVCVVGGALVLRRQKAPTPAPLPAAAAIVTPSASAVVPQALATIEPPAPASASAPAASAVVPVAPSVAAQVATAVARPVPVAGAPRNVPGASGASSASKPAATTKPSCDPPYYFDAQGARIFKKECL